MKKKYVVLLLMLFLITGCFNKQSGSNKNTNSNLPNIGDIVNYQDVVSLNEYSTDNNLTGSSEEQTFTTNKDLKWVVISNKDGIKLVADHNTLSSSDKGIGFNGKEGYLNGVNVLDSLCDKLYTTSYGKGRSIKVDDIVSLINNEKERKNKANNTELTFTSGTFYDGSSFKEASSSNSITVKSNYYNYVFNKDLDLFDVVALEAASNSSATFFNNNKHYWVANDGIYVYSYPQNDSMNYVGYGLHVMRGGLIGINETLKANKYELYQDTTSYYGVRPVIELNSSTKLTRVNDNTWKIDN